MDDTTTDTEDPTTPVAETDPTEESTVDVDDVDGVSEDAVDESDDDGRGSGAREAAKYRRQLRATETERDQLRDQLTAQRRAVIDWRSSNAVGGSVDPQLLDAAGIDVDDFIDPETGHLDMTAVDAFIDSTAVKFRVQRTMKPNKQQGQPSQAATGGSWSDVIQGGAKSR